jgi:hypothetical protein
MCVCIGLLLPTLTPHQESSSEAIAAYEAVALYGDAMAGVFQGTSSAEDRQALETR